MPIKPEEHQNHYEFVNEQAKVLQSLDVDKNQLVWHYTTGEALINIVESGSLYATQVACLNDSTEVRYGETLLRNAFFDLQKESSADDEAQPLFERILKSEPVEAPHQQTASDWFVTCFSKEKDDLSQWRAYSGGENGFAIAFVAGAFFGRGCLMVRVNYDKNQHLSAARTIAEAMLRFFREGLVSRTPEERQTWLDDFALDWRTPLGQLAPMVKDPAFRGENEFRIAYEFKPQELSKLRFRQKGSLMSIHMPLVFPPTISATQSTQLPIMEVMVGPSRHKEISRLSVDVLLRQRGYKGVPVSMSSIPFQTT